MFETVDSAEILYPAALATAGIKVWAFTGHGLQLPWFHVSMGTASNGGGYSRIIFASSLAQVLQLKSTRRRRQSLTVKLVSPPFLNGTDQWKMELLHAVWKARDSDQVVYVVEGRRHYTERSEDRVGFTSLDGYERVY